MNLHRNLPRKMNPKTEESKSGKKAGGPRIATVVATAFGLGYLPAAPGTWGSLGGLALAMGICWGTRAFAAGTEVVVYLVACVCVAIAGVWASGRVVEHTGNNDPQHIVVDEVSGQLLALIGARTEWGEPGGWKYLAAGFILFRAFDIWKPFPARRAERWRGGWGVMADDWIAGAYAAITLLVARAFLP